MFDYQMVFILVCPQETPMKFQVRRAAGYALCLARRTSTWKMLRHLEDVGLPKTWVFVF